MTTTDLSRFTQTLLLAAIVAALAAPAVALAGANSGYGPRDGWYTYAVSVTKSDRNAASDSNRYGPRDGWYTYAVSVTNSAKALTVDGRSPDTLAAADTAQLQVADGRSPDTLDAAVSPQPVAFVQPGRFDWADAGIGAATGAALIALLGSLLLLLVRSHRRQRVQAM